MASEPVLVALLPRFTALNANAPSGTFYTEPMDVSAFASVVLTAWRSHGLQTGYPPWVPPGGQPPSLEATVEFALEASPDMETWSALGAAFTPATPESEVTATREFSVRWMRLKTTVSGDWPGITVWINGIFVPREVG